MEHDIKEEEEQLAHHPDVLPPTSKMAPSSSIPNPTTASVITDEHVAKIIAQKKYEARILSQAKDIRDRRSYARRAPAPEPNKRIKTHWDHLLDEMSWLAKEFQKERRWKLQTAKKYANAVQRSNLDVESRVEIKAKEEERSIRRKAAWIAKEISNFWTKAQRVVSFKVHSQIEAKKKEVLDRQLDALLGQTQKYSSLLAQRLAAEERGEAVAAASKAQHLSDSSKALVEDEDFPLLHDDSSAGHEPTQPVPPPHHAALRTAPSAAVSGTAAHDADDSKDYRSGEDDDADDEATLEEEEAMAEAEGINIDKDREEEAAGLAADADLPIEELLARYGYVVAPEGTEPGPSLSHGNTARSTQQNYHAHDEDDEGSHGLAELLRDDAHQGMDTAQHARVHSRLAEEFADLKNQEDDGNDRESMGEGGSSHADGRGTAVDDDEYRSGEDDDADDEATLEEEEAMAEAEGINIDKDREEEAAGLAADADLPIEELLARYGYMVPSEQILQDGVELPKERDSTIANASAATNNKIVNKTSTAVASGDEGNDLTMAGTLQAMVDMQPTGFTLETTQVKTPVPFLLKGQLREYQHIGLDWLVTLYERRLNGILADEMGLGKTIQTIALLAWLAAEKGDWGPHLVVVPTSVMLNWEMEFKRWAPAFKLLTYYGSPKERAAKRQGWSKPNAFHVAITSYTLVLQDARVFKRKKWKYLILDEAHMIKNWRSQRWQTLLNFNSKRRLLITGTPLQNDLMELWSLMHFLMPQVFSSHAQFKDWFSNPLTGMVEGSAEYNKAIIERLHGVLRPFLLRRLKRDVEKQLPGKHEHVLRCRLSKRQRQLYEEYMASRDTRATLSSGNFLGIMNCLMQLRKVCNHPDLFEGRPIISAYDMIGLEVKMPSAVVMDVWNGALWNGYSSSSSVGGYVHGIGRASRKGGFGFGFASHPKPDAVHASSSSIMSQSQKINDAPIDLLSLGLMPVLDGMSTVDEAWHISEISSLHLDDGVFAKPLTTPQEDVALLYRNAHVPLPLTLGRNPSQSALMALTQFVRATVAKRRAFRQSTTALLGRISQSRTSRAPSITIDIIRAANVEMPVRDVHIITAQCDRDIDQSIALTTLMDMIKLPSRRASEMNETLSNFVFVIPKARATPPVIWCSRPSAAAVESAAERARATVTASSFFMERSAVLHVPRQRGRMFFPDRRLIQYDCGKLQELAVLLAKLKSGGHRALIFTQMSKMLDILEAFLNLHAYTYVRLDGATKPEQRQILMQRFNTDERIFCFILSTRSGGVGMNLTGADTVIFYDSDWNPAMDAQAQDRCHRIGQTREVHIYRLISEHTIEENILKKSDQKRHLDFLAIQSGGFTTEILSRFDPKALLLEGGEGGGAIEVKPGDEAAIRAAMRAAEDEGDAQAAAEVEREAAAEMDEFIKEPPPPGLDDGPGGADTGAVDGTVSEGRVVGEQDAGVGSEENREPEGEDTAAAPDEGGKGLSAVKENQHNAIDEDEAMKEIVAMAGGTTGGDALAHLESALRPIERYAVRFVEIEGPMLDKDLLEAQLEATYKVDEFDVDAIEAAEEEREADIDDDEDANMVADWDHNAADAYAQQVKAAEEEEKARAEAEAAWYAQYGIPVVAATTGEATSMGGGECVDTALSPTAAGMLYHDTQQHRGLPAAKKRKLLTGAPSAHGAATPALSTAPPPLPWEPLEDFVLSSVVSMLLEGGYLPGDTLWKVSSDVLAAGGASSSMHMTMEMPFAVSPSHHGSKRKRSIEACRQRYAQLRSSFVAMRGLGDDGEVESAIRRVAMAKDALKGLVGAAQLPGASREAVGAMYAALMVGAMGAPDGKKMMLLSTLHAMRAELVRQSHMTEVAPVASGMDDETPANTFSPAAHVALPEDAPGFAVAGPVDQAQEIASAVRLGCGSGAARVISGRLPTLIEAALAGVITADGEHGGLREQQQQQGQEFVGFDPMADLIA